jgi:Neuraminidase (sialidase)
VAPVTDDFVTPAPGSSFRQDATAFPPMAVAPGGTLYVAWANRTGDPANGHAVVMVAKSTDGGLTWSTTPVAAGNGPAHQGRTARTGGLPWSRVNRRPRIARIE